MNESIQKLSSILQQEFKIYNDLYYLLDEEYNFLLNSDGDEIRKTLEAKEAFLKKIESLEADREILCNEIAEDLGIQKPARLSDIAQKVDLETAKVLLTWKGTFDELLQNLKDKNEANNILAGSALESVGSTIKAVKDSLQTTNIYEKKGSVKKNEQVDHLLSKKA